MENTANTQVINNETQENNKLIAEFMGLKPRLISPDVYGYSDGNSFTCIHDTPEKVIESISKYAKYHSDWNWLMLVVEKIVNLKDAYAQERQRVFSSITPNINTTYTAVVSFIKWYNANK